MPSISCELEELEFSSQSQRCVFHEKAKENRICDNQSPRCKFLAPAVKIPYKIPQNKVWIPHFAPNIPLSLSFWSSDFPLWHPSKIVILGHWFWLNLIGYTFQHNQFFYRFTRPQGKFLPRRADFELGAVNPEETTEFSWGLKGWKKKFRRICSIPQKNVSISPMQSGTLPLT